MAKLKYMGSSHVHTLDKGDNFGGRLSEGLSSDVSFSRDNAWIVDTEEAGLSQEAVDVLTESGDFKDVTDAKRIPTNLHQQIFLGMAKSEASDSADEDEEAEEPRGEAKPEGSEPAQGTTETDATPTTTTGGSTRGGGRRGA